MGMNTPRVFVSHASEDKERFVIPFATKLREKGIDAWIDKWEMRPGDSLVQKIFEEGIKNAVCFIVVLSKYSVNKKWVKEELDAVIIKRIEDNAKIIPIIIDECDIPIALISTMHVKIDIENNYDSKIKEIINSIYNFSEKPIIGQPPEYITNEIISYPNLQKQDVFIFNSACEFAIENDDYRIYSEELVNQINSNDISMSILQESLSILENEGYIYKLGKAANGYIYNFFIDNFYFTKYLRNKLTGYDTINKNVALKICNQNKRFSIEIAKELELPHMVVVNILENFLQNNYFEVTKAVPNIIIVNQINPSMKRMINNLD